MLRILAIVVGIIFIGFGVLGFIPEFTPDGKLLTLFKVNFEQNMLHIISGVTALLCGLSSGFSSKMFFIIGGITYGFLGLYGLYVNQDMLFEMIANNQANNFLHLGTGLFLSLIGFGLKY